MTANFGTPSRRNGKRVDPALPLWNNQDLLFFLATTSPPPHSQVIFAGDCRIFSSLLPRVFNSRPVSLLIAFFAFQLCLSEVQRVAPFF